MTLFHGPVILPCISDSIKYEGIILWILVLSDTVSDLIPFVGHLIPAFYGPVILPCISGSI